MRRDMLLLALGAAAVLTTATAHIRVETPRRSIAIEVAASGVTVTVRDARLDCGRDVALAGCPSKQPAKPKPV